MGKIERNLYIIHCSKNYKFNTITSKYLEVKERLRIEGKLLYDTEVPLYQFIDENITSKWIAKRKGKGYAKV